MSQSVQFENVLNLLNLVQDSSEMVLSPVRHEVILELAQPLLLEILLLLRLYAADDPVQIVWVFMGTVSSIVHLFANRKFLINTRNYINR